MKIFIRMINALIVFYTANAYILPVVREHIYFLIILVVCFLLINLFPSVSNRNLPTLRLRICGDGCELLMIFLISTVLSLIHLLLNIRLDFTLGRIVGMILMILIEAIVFWNGMIRVYLTSSQLAIKWRLIGIFCGWIPLIHLWALYHIIRIALKETVFESSKIQINKERQKDQVCRTKYPILLVHGVFFRDFKYLNYWGRIPDELAGNGATIYYGNQQSAASIADSGKEIAERILQITWESGYEKVNIIAHSKGGLDCRYAISECGANKYVASLTTVNTPHRGCLFADYLLTKIPLRSRNFVAQQYNGALRKLGDNNPDFLAAVNELTSVSCKKINESVLDMPDIFYQSVGSKLNQSSGGRFPLNFSYHLVNHFDGLNDGLVSIDSFKWGEKNTLLTVRGKRGISHGDMIDLNRENIDEFDVREFYVALVRDLKDRGL